ncbi:MAG: hypothetical protein HFG15_00745 [Bacilli bacterium]|nr:hypothetical protein [Bacilli bacterium]
MGNEEMLRKVLLEFAQLGMPEQFLKQLRDKYAANPPFLMIVTPDGEIYHYLMKHSENHFSGYQQFYEEVLRKQQIFFEPNILNDYRELESHIFNLPCLIFRTWLDLSNFEIMCYAAVPTLTPAQQQVKDEIDQMFLNPENSHLVDRGEQGEVYILNTPLTHFSRVQKVQQR